MDYATAEILYQRTKMFAEKYFPQRTYRIDLITVRFRPITESIWTTQNEYKIAWYKGIADLQGISAAMYDDLLLPPLESPQTKVIEDTSKIQSLTEKLESAYINTEKANNKLLDLKRKVLFVAYITLFSIALWTFNSFLNWEWLSNHQKKIPIYLGFQLLIFVSSLRIISKNKAIKYLDLIIAILIAIFSFL